MDDSKIVMLPEGNKSIDPSLLLAMGNGGFGGMNNPFWMMFMLPFLYPFFGSMFGGNGWFGNGFGGNNGTGFLANQLNNDAGRDLILQAINGRADALGQLATITHHSISDVQSAINTANIKLQEVGSQVGMSGLQVINAIQSGNASLARQLCECCCENRLAISEQTNAISAQAAANHAAATLQTAQNHADDRLDVCQQTNELKTQAIQDTQSIKDAIAAQSIMINDKFCDLEKRELQNKITAQGDIITQLRGEISNDKQTEKFNSAFAVLNDKLNQVAAKQPNTVPVTWPNLVAVNSTPNTGWYNGFNSWGYNFPGGSYWG